MLCSDCIAAAPPCSWFQALGYSKRARNGDGHCANRDSILEDVWTRVLDSLEHTLALEHEKVFSLFLSRELFIFHKEHIATLAESVRQAVRASKVVRIKKDWRRYNNI